MDRHDHSIAQEQGVKDQAAKDGDFDLDAAQCGEFGLNCAGDGLPDTQLKKFQMLWGGLSSIKTLANIQAGFAVAECLVMDGYQAKRLSKQGQLELAQAISILSEYLADDVLNLAHLLPKPGKGRAA